MSRRILDETIRSTFASDDYVYMDGQTNGSSKITPDNLVRNTTVAQQLAQHIADAEDDVEQITGDIETIQSDISGLKSDIGDLEDLETTDKSSLVNAINEARGSGGSGLTEEIKQALLQIANSVAYPDEDGQTYIDALEQALYPPAELASISAVYTQSGTVYDTDTLDSLKTDLVVTAHYDDSTTENVSAYTLSGTLTEGTSTITVAYGGMTTTFNVTVSVYQVLSEVLTVSAGMIDFTTFEDASGANYWRFGAGTLQANKLRFTWNSEECNGFQITIAQYDSSGNPYKLSNVQSYSSSPTTDGASINQWANPGSYKYTALGGGNIEVALPTTGLVKVVTRKSSGSGTAVTDNATYNTWLTNGGLTVTAIQE